MPDVATRPTKNQPSLTEPELVIREARRRQRHRWLIGSCALLLLVSVVLLVLGTSGSTPTTRPNRPEKHPTDSPRPVTIPFGSSVALDAPGPLAVSQSNLVYVFDPSQHRVMVRRASGQFYDVAGDGTYGSGGDGGAAIRAQLSNVSDIAFAPSGDLYMADGARVRVVGGNGVIHTVAGDGLSGGGPVDPGTPARSAHLGTVQSIAFSPSGQLFVATSRQILRLSPRDELDPVRADVTSGPAKGALSGFGSIAIDGQGNVYASSLTTGWSVYRISTAGRATYLGYARRSGGNLAILQRRGGQIEADDGPSLLVVDGNKMVPVLAVNQIPGISNFIFMNYFAVTPGGGVVADNLGPGFDRYQQIVSVEVGRGYSMWVGPAEQQALANEQLAEAAAQQAAQQAALQAAHQ